MTTERITEQGCGDNCQYPGGCLLRRDGVCSITGQWAMVRVPDGANIATRKCADCGSNHSPYSCRGQLPGQPVELHDCQSCGLMHKPGPCPNTNATPDVAEIAGLFANSVNELTFDSRKDALDTFTAATLLQSGGYDMILTADWGDDGHPWYFFLTRTEDGASVLGRFGKLVVDGDDGDAAESGEPAAYFLDREFYSDNMDFPPNFDNGPNPLGEDY